MSKFAREPCDGTVEVEFPRAAIAEAIEALLSRLHVNPALLTFVPIEEGRTQVSVHGFGPFGVLEAG